MKKLFLFFLLLSFFSFSPTNNDYDIFFGDSITFGNELGPLQYSDRWSTKYCHAVPTDEANYAYSGEAMTPGLNAGRPVFNIAGVPTYESRYRHIFVSYWVNDFIYGGTPAAYTAATTAAVNGIIAKGWPAAKIVLCFNYMPESPGTWVDMTHTKALQWLAALRSVQQAKGTSFLDFYTPIYNRPDKASYTGDLVHPTAAWNEIMKQYAQTNIEGPSSTLPVSITGFSGQRQGSAIALTWTVAQEQNVSHYEVNRSQDGAAWTRMGDVASTGNTTTARSYTFTDNNAGPGKQLYRLRAVDKNGATKFSPVIIINGAKAAQLSLGNLFPNPAISTLNVIVNAPAKQTITLQVVDAAGHAVKTQVQSVDAGVNTTNIDLSRVGTGTYFIQLIGESTETTVVERFIKR